MTTAWIAWCEQAYTAILRSPTEYESTPAVSALMQSYFLKLLSRYRDFIEPDAADPAQADMHHDSNHHPSENARAEHLTRPSSSRHTSITGEDDSSYLRSDRVPPCMQICVNESFASA